MEHYNITLTTEDRRILNSYCTVATGMAEFWGENCEIIIHNLERLDASVMMIVNGYHSGRQAGPLRKKDSWNSRIHSAHAMRVERRCSMALTIHLAWRTLPVR